MKLIIFIEKKLKSLRTTLFRLATAVPDWPTLKIQVALSTL